MEQNLTVTLGPRQCINCGSPLLTDAIYCHRCGTRQPPPAITLELTGESSTADAAPFVLEDAGIKHIVGRTIEPLEHYVQVDLAPCRGKEQGVSRSHAEIWFNDDEFTWQVRDIGSQFGTFVNGDQLDEGQTANLENGQMLRFGGIELRVALEF